MKNIFQYLNDYYDRIYVLSIENAIGRRSKFLDRFTGMNYDFYFGANKNTFSVEELAQSGSYNDSLSRRHHRYSKNMKPGEIACSWSHKMIYEDMLANNYERILIFEDDAMPDPSAIKNIPSIINEIPDDCEILMWGWSKNGRSTPAKRLKQLFYHVQHSLGLLKWDHTIIRNLYARPHSRYLKKKGFHDYTYAYGINRCSAEKLIQMQTPIQYIADNLLAHAATKGIINGYIAYPAVFLHDNLPDGTHRDSYIR